MVKKIKKREGYREEFNEQKIISAVLKAMVEVDEVNEDIAERIAHLIGSCGKDYLTVEEIQDMIEQYLLEMKQFKAAKAFILYRQKRAAKRSRLELMNYNRLYLRISTWRKVRLLTNGWTEFQR